MGPITTVFTEVFSIINLQKKISILFLLAFMVIFIVPLLGQRRDFLAGACMHARLPSSGSWLPIQRNCFQFWNCNISNTSGWNKTEHWNSLVGSDKCTRTRKAKNKNLFAFPLDEGYSLLVTCFLSFNIFWYFSSSVIARDLDTWDSLCIRRSKGQLDLVSCHFCICSAGDNTLCEIAEVYNKMNQGGDWEKRER